MTLVTNSKWEDPALMESFFESCIKLNDDDTLELDFSIFKDDSGTAGRDKASVDEESNKSNRKKRNLLLVNDGLSLLARQINLSLSRSSSIINS